MLTQIFFAAALDVVGHREQQLAVIIDYKTGQYLEKHQQQLQTYASVVKQLGYIVEKKILVYIHPELTIKTVI